MFGVDEAGRGPIVGPLYVGFVDAPTSALPDGLADSKTLSRSRIRELADVLVSTPDVVTACTEIPTGVIDTDTRDLTTLTADTMATLIQEHATSRVGVVDACHQNPAVFCARVESSLPDTTGVDLTAEHGADETVEQVMAASIIAKDNREQYMDALNDRYDAYGPIGSGYPSDPDTISFLEAYVEETGDLPSETRRSWSTAENLLASAEQTALSDY